MRQWSVMSWNKNILPLFSSSDSRWRCMSRPLVIASYVMMSVAWPSPRLTGNMYLSWSNWADRVLTWSCIPSPSLQWGIRKVFPMKMLWSMISFTWWIVSMAYLYLSVGRLLLVPSLTSLTETKLTGSKLENSSFISPLTGVIPRLGYLGMLYWQRKELASSPYSLVHTQDQLRVPLLGAGTA